MQIVSAICLLLPFFSPSFLCLSCSFFFLFFFIVFFFSVSLSISLISFSFFSEKKVLPKSLLHQIDTVVFDEADALLSGSRKREVESLLFGIAKAKKARETNERKRESEAEERKEGEVKKRRFYQSCFLHPFSFFFFYLHFGSYFFKHSLAFF